jgi:hypothetical protein
MQPKTAACVIDIHPSNSAKTPASDGLHKNNGWSGRAERLQSEERKTHEGISMWIVGPRL